MKMKNYTLIPLYLLFYTTTGFAQGQYFTEMFIKPNCACQPIQIFSNNQNDKLIPDFVHASKCALFVADTFPLNKNFYAFKRHKKKPKPTYPKTSNIIRF